MPENGLVRILGIARADPGQRDRLVSPIGIPPTYGLANVDWGWKGFGQGEYQIRSEQVRGVMQQMQGIPGILLHEFTAKRWFNILSALFNSFDVTTDEIKDWESVLRVAGKNTQEMVNRGLFGTKPDELYEATASRPITDLSALRTRDLDQIILNVALYRGLPDDMRDFLEGVNLLLLPQRENRFRVAVSLKPRSERDVPDSKYLRFYERLAQLGIPGIFDIRGQDSFLDGYLGRFDVAAKQDTSRLLFPQWAVNQAELKPAPEIYPMKLESRNTGADKSLAQLVGDRYQLEISRTPKGIEVYIDKDLVVPNDPEYAAELADKLLDREKAPMQSTHNIDFARLKAKQLPSLRPRSQNDEEIQRRLGDERTSQLYDKDGNEVNITATNVYHQIVDRFYGGGAINASVIKGELEQVVGLLSEEQRDLIGIALINYAADSMQRGQFGDIEGFEEACILLGRSGMLPEVAERLRMYVDLLPQGTITKILCSVDHFGNATPDVYNLHVPSDEDKKAAKNPALAELYAHHKEQRVDSWMNEDTGRPIHLADHQEELRSRLREYVQQYLPIAVTDDILRELRKYGEMVQLMQGRSAFLDTMSPKLAITLTMLCESSIGRLLTGPGELRNALPYSAKEAVNALPNYHVQQPPQSGPN